MERLPSLPIPRHNLSSTEARHVFYRTTTAYGTLFQSAEVFDVTLELLRTVLLPPLYTLLAVHVSLPR